MIGDSDRFNLGLALTVSSQSTFGRVKIGAVVACKGTPAGHGWNERRTHPRQYYANLRVGKQIESPCLHAELAAIIDAESRGNKFDTIYVARLDRGGSWANCRPCTACDFEIRRTGIKKVVYTTEAGINHYDC